MTLKPHPHFGRLALPANTLHCLRCKEGWRAGHHLPLPTNTPVAQNVSGVGFLATTSLPANTLRHSKCEQSRLTTSLCLPTPSSPTFQRQDEGWPLCPFVPLPLNARRCVHHHFDTTMLSTQEGFLFDATRRFLPCRIEFLLFNMMRRCAPPNCVEFSFFDATRRCKPPCCVEFWLLFSFWCNKKVHTPLLLETSGGGFFCTSLTPHFKQWVVFAPTTTMLLLETNGGGSFAPSTSWEFDFK